MDKDKNDTVSEQFSLDLLMQSETLDKRFYHLRDALGSEEYRKAMGSLLFPLGKEESGKFVIADLHKLPHIIAGGQTGSGKSNFTEGILITSLLYGNSSDGLKLLLIDPKWVQFTQYNGIPHLLRPVITTPEASKEAVGWLLDEMEDRYKKLEASNVHDIEQYNALGSEHLPFIVLIIDEVSDLMMVDGRYYEAAFVNLFQKSAAVGIHTYIGTSRPSVDVITSLLKANNPTRIAFTTASKIDSLSLLNVEGAENLQGKGDMLFTSPDYLRPIRLQAPYVSDQDLVKVIERLRSIHTKDKEM